MASTFSPTLRLELIGDGDQSGIWGQTTNTNLGTLLEQAITGVVSITMVDANYTLTNFNGVSDEARNAVLVVGGTNAAVRDIIAPLAEKLYVVRNFTSGGFAINVRAASGSSVSVPNGATVWVYCDGTNFNAIGTESVGNFEVNGNLTVTGNTNAVAATYTGNVVALNYSTAGNVTATGNATAANFIGAGLTITSINASNISAGTIANARTTADSANGASTIVVRDSGGNFIANTITANLTGTATNATNATNATTVTGATQNSITSIPNLATVGTITSGTWSGSFGAVSGANLTNLNASNLASGTVPSARLSGSYGISISGTAATATAPASGGTFVTSSNIGSQSVNFATTAGNGGVTSVNSLSGAVSLPIGVQGQAFTSSGTFTIPANITNLKVTVVGGGGGGSSDTNPQSGKGGGAGGAAISYLTGLTPGNTLTVTVGAGGSGGVFGSATGNNGSASTVSSGTQSITTITAGGGFGGPPSGNPGSGGTSSGGTINITGGGGAAGAGGNGSGMGGSSIFGGGGRGAQGSQNGGNGSTGGGGGGAQGLDLTGGNGGNGIVIFEF
jgi:hypothetical protein